MLESGEYGELVEVIGEGVEVMGEDLVSMEVEDKSVLVLGKE